MKEVEGQSRLRRCAPGAGPQRHGIQGEGLDRGKFNRGANTEPELGHKDSEGGNGPVQGRSNFEGKEAPKIASRGGGGGRKKKTWGTNWQCKGGLERGGPKKKGNLTVSQVRGGVAPEKI